MRYLVRKPGFCIYEKTQISCTLHWAFCFCCTGRRISLASKFKISSLKLASSAAQTSLCFAWSENQKIWGSGLGGDTAQINIAKVSKAHIPPAVAIRGHTNSIGKREKSTNKGTDKQYVAEFSIHCTTCHI